MSIIILQDVNTPPQVVASTSQSAISGALGALLDQVDLAEWQSEYLLSEIDYHEQQLERYIQQHREVMQWRRELRAALNASMAEVQA